MTFWDFMLIVFKWMGSKFSRITNSIAGVLAILAISGVFSVKVVLGLNLGISIINYLRAQWISDTVDNAKAIVASAKADSPLPMPQEGKP